MCKFFKHFFRGGQNFTHKNNNYFFVFMVFADSICWFLAGGSPESGGGELASGKNSPDLDRTQPGYQGRSILIPSPSRFSSGHLHQKKARGEQTCRLRNSSNTWLMRCMCYPSQAVQYSSSSSAPSKVAFPCSEMKHSSEQYVSKSLYMYPSLMNLPQV